MGMLISMYINMADDLTLRFKQEVLGSTKVATLKRKRSISVGLEAKDLQSESGSKKGKSEEEAVGATNLHPEILSLYHDTLFNNKLKYQEKYVLKEPVFGYINYDLTQKGHVNLFSFLIEVMVDQRLNYGTALYAMQLFDQVLAHYEGFRKDRVLLIGSACLTLACKLEEIYPLELEALLTQAHYCYSLDELFCMEHEILRIMNYNIFFPTRLDFANYYAELLSLSPRQHHLVDYLIGISYADYNFNYMPASKVVACAVHLALQLTMPSKYSFVWTSKCSYLTKYSEADLLEGIVRLRALHTHFFDYPLQHLVHVFTGESRGQVADIYGLSHSHMRLLEANRYILKEKEEHVYISNPSYLAYHYRTPPIVDALEEACSGGKAQNSTVRIIKPTTKPAHAIASGRKK